MKENKDNPAVSNRSIMTVSITWFALAFAIRGAFVFNWLDICGLHPDLSLVGDAYEYKELAEKLYQIALNGSVGLDSHTVIDNTKNLVSGLLMAGPVFPLYLAFGLAIGHWLQTFQQFLPIQTAPLLIQIFVSSATVALLGACSEKLYKGTGKIAALLASLYPGFIINCHRLTTESLAIFLVTLALFAFLRVSKERKRSLSSLILLAISLILLQLLRSALLPLSLLFGLATLIILIAEKEKKKAALFLMAASLSISPWLLFECAVKAPLSLCPDRAGNLNVAVGNDTESDGWTRAPYPIYAGLVNEKPLSILKLSIKTSTRKWLELTLGKIPRLIKAPWNDFRTAIGAFSYANQTLYHQLILALAAIGILLAAAAKDERRHISLKVALAINALHFVYIPFVAMPRYFVTAMPVLIMLAARAIAALCRSENKALVMPLAVATLLCLLSLRLHAGWLNTLLAASGAIISLIAIRPREEKSLQYWLFGVPIVVLTAINSLPLAANGRIYDSYSLKNDYAISLQNLEQTSDASLQGKELYLLIAPGPYQNLFNRFKIKYNGEALSAPAISTIALLDDQKTLAPIGNDHLIMPYQYIFSSLCTAADLNLIEANQYFLIKLPCRDKKEIESLVLSPTSSEGTELPAARAAKDRLQMFDPRYYSWDKMFYGVENSLGFSDCRLEYSHKLEKGSGTVIEKQPMARIVALPAVPHPSRQIILKDSISLEVSADKPETIAAPLDKSAQESLFGQSILRIKGEIAGSQTQIQSASSAIEPGMDVTLTYDCGGATRSLGAPLYPHRVKELDKHSYRFDFAVPVLLNDAASKDRPSLEKIELTLKAHEPLMRDFYKAKTKGKVQFKNITISLEDYCPSALASGIAVY
ncbi:MAG: hypothetical protein LCH63_09675 [Candidatus Melainabacteria bacterium]|nr:hypothetical protein [Candidatus Melainabacteria bacterium]